MAKRSDQDQVTGFAGCWAGLTTATTDGVTIYPYGSSPVGLLIFTEKLYFAETLSVDASTLPRLPSSSDRSSGTAEQNAAVIAGTLGQEGKYTVDEDQDLESNVIRTSTFPNYVGAARNTSALRLEVDMTGQRVTEVLQDYGSPPLLMIEIILPLHAAPFCPPSLDASYTKYYIAHYSTRQSSRTPEYSGPLVRSAAIHSSIQPNTLFRENNQSLISVATSPTRLIHYTTGSSIPSFGLANQQTPPPLDFLHISSIILEDNMFAKASTVFAILAVAAQVVVATPPACVIGAVNTQDDPSDFKAVCGASEVQQYMSSKCGNYLDTAQSYFSDYCKANDAQVASISSSTSSSSHSATKSSSGASHSATSTGSASPSEAGTHSSSSTMTAGAAYPVGTGASGFTTSAIANGSYTAGTATGTVPSQTESGLASSTGGAARLGMDLVGMAALGVFGAMLAL
ncbi:hypothetical protein AC579_4350 [Pseudocercospora musae]|uniref:Lipocalin-like domain-containing protein n=1 Tax=Pseudocercospora musae TaxID=113226 RepID=A0A139IQM9_9PEZI|nr:hypothetical protein AC579_4350 [Pseudocercospora musae]